MPLYDFECAPCAYYTEIRQGIDDPSTHECPHCNQETLVKVFINSPSFFVRGEPNTIGQWADKNTRNMGTYEKQDNDRKYHTNNNPEHRKKRDMHRKINSMTQKQKLKWIKEGD
tara:strand:- start:1784 stop:2125 length:342 start_codon:yes stop_codon:yes gene_type:complete